MHLTVISSESLRPSAVTLSGPTNVDEGDTLTYRFTTTDPGDDTFSLVATSGGSAGTVVNQVFVPGTGEGFFDVLFSDGPAPSTVSVQVQDSDGAVSNISLNDVWVANVAPTIALLGASSVDEGSPYTLTLDDITDPGNDTIDYWNIDWGDGSADTELTSSSSNPAA